jgi:hypothetical protein
MNDSQDKHPKVFSVEEANRMLPLVRAIVRDLVQLSSEVTDRRHRLNDLMSGRELEPHDVYSAELAEVERGLQQDTKRLRSYLEELRQLGVEAKGDDGLVDFPSTRNGRQVYLCWKLDEPEVGYWHEANEGFAGRRPLTPSKPSGDADQDIQLSGNSLS